MKKLLFSLLSFCLLLTACLETTTHTAIRENGSGSMVATVDLGTMMTMMAGNKSKTETFSFDTVMYIRNHSDTSKLLTDYQKKLMKDMFVKVKMSLEEGKEPAFVVSINAPFESLEDFNALNELMKKKEYDQVFDKAMEIPMFSDKNKKEAGSGGDNDNLFTSIFPSFYNCVYSKNSVVCKLDEARHKQTLEELKKSEFDINGEMEAKMFGSAIFTNTLTLPSKPKKIEGDSWKPGSSDKDLVQTGNLLDLYKQPEKYAYSIQY